MLTIRYRITVAFWQKEEVFDGKICTRFLGYKQCSILSSAWFFYKYSLYNS